MQLVLLANYCGLKLSFDSLNIACTHMISGFMAVHALAWVFNTDGSDVTIHNSMI